MRHHHVLYTATLKLPDYKLLNSEYYKLEQKSTLLK